MRLKQLLQEAPFPRSSLPPTARVWSTLRTMVREFRSPSAKKFFSRFSPRNRRERVWVWPLWRAALPSAMENLRGKVQFETDAARDLKSVCPLLRRLYEDNSDRGR